jgi:preprotein translocase subunit SecA
MRKHLLEYDDVMNKQREAVYGLRRRILEGKETREHVLTLTREVLEWYLDSYCGEKRDPDDWNLEGLRVALKETYGLDVPLAELKALGRDQALEELGRRCATRYEDKERVVGAELMLLHQRLIMLQIVDTQWKDHLYSLDHLKEGIGLRGYGQRDPLVEYKKESFQMFQALMDRIDEEILRWVYLYQPVASPPAAEDGGGANVRQPRPTPPRGGPAAAATAPPGVRAVREPELALAGARTAPRNLSFNDPSEAPSAFARAERPEARGGGDEVQTVRREGKKVGRNDPCPCGSGRKYKKCHGAS